MRGLITMFRNNVHAEVVFHTSVSIRKKLILTKFIARQNSTHGIFKYRFFKLTDVDQYLYDADNSKHVPFRIRKETSVSWSTSTLSTNSSSHPIRRIHTTSQVDMTQIHNMSYPRALFFRQITTLLQFSLCTAQVATSSNLSSTEKTKEQKRKCQKGSRPTLVSLSPGEVSTDSH